MANRSYLYSSNIVPGPNAKIGERKLIGISEWNYAIPITFKILLSGNPRMCRSSIWENNDEIALVGDYATGVENLAKFLFRVDSPLVRGLIDEALQALNAPQNRNPYLVLECGEIYAMSDTPFLEQNRALLAQVKDLDSEIEEALKSLAVPVQSAEPVGFLSKLLGRSPAPVGLDPMQPIYALGLGNWSNVLYFHFGAENEKDDPGTNARPEASQSGDSPFERWAEAQGFSVLPGRYGGPLNSDMLALGDRDGRTTLVLGSKTVDSTGAFRLDDMSLGAHKQLTSRWLDVLVYSLSQSDETSHFAEAIESARDYDGLATEVLFVDSQTGDCCVAEVTVDEP